MLNIRKEISLPLKQVDLIKYKSIKLKDSYPSLKKIHRYNSLRTKGSNYRHLFNLTELQHATVDPLTVEEIIGDRNFIRSVIFPDGQTTGYILHKLTHSSEAHHSIGKGVYGDYRLLESINSYSKNVGVKVVNSSLKEWHNKEHIASINREKQVNQLRHELYGLLQRQHKVYFFTKRHHAKELFFYVSQVRLANAVIDKFAIGLEVLFEITCLHKRLNRAHCDLKLENCLWSPEYKQIYLIDFGMSRVLDDNKYTLASCGSPHYMAWETICHNKVFKKSDVAAMARILAFVFFPMMPQADLCLKKVNKPLGNITGFGFSFNKFSKLKYVKSLVKKEADYKKLLHLIQNMSNPAVEERFSSQESLLEFANIFPNVVKIHKARKIKLLAKKLKKALVGKFEVEHYPATEIKKLIFDMENLNAYFPSMTDVEKIFVNDNISLLRILLKQATKPFIAKDFLILKKMHASGDDDAKTAELKVKDKKQQSANKLDNACASCYLL